MSQFLGIFIDEGREQLDLLESSFLTLEKSDRSPELLQDLFRAAHTLKGSSKAMGFNSMGELTHRMEDVLDAVRHNQLGTSPELISVLLACTDMLNGFMDSIAASGTDEVTDPAAFSGLIDNLGGYLGGGTAAVAGGEAPGKPKAASKIKAAAEPKAATTARPGLDRNTHNLTVTFEETCEFCGVRAEMVLAVAEEIGEVLSTSPKRGELDLEAFGRSFELTVATELDLEAAMRKLGAVSEVSGVARSSDQIHQAGGTEPEPAPEAQERAEEGPKNSKPDSKPATGSSPPSRSTGPASSSQTIRVDVGRLDALLNLVGELVTDRTQMANLAGALNAKYHGDELASHILEATMRIARVTGELQDEIMKTRMLPIDNAFQRMPRVVRDLAQNLGKEIQLEISGGDTEIDRSLIDALSDPLIHLLRNCVDHGIEDPEGRRAAGKPATGLVRMSARHEENNIVIEICDDGKGIDPDRIKRKAVESELLSAAAAQAMTDAEALRLIFSSGLSTAQEVSEISGRGVGMDIVKTNLEKIGGRVHLESKLGEGTMFTIRLPLTLAIMRALLVESASVTYALPLCSVVETLRLGISDSEVKRERLTGKCAMVLRGETVPLTNLQAMLCKAEETSSTNMIPKDACVVVVGSGTGQVGLCVDTLRGEQEIVIKPLGSLLGDIHGISGASILGDGRVALIVDATKAMVQAA
ncbi:MAG TPA: chemotaxis protein CheA [Fimbriimonadaceae bacterium]|nr:chemotaxis protein CheA [Fimbriimonadaceae bacterium]